VLLVDITTLSHGLLTQYPEAKVLPGTLQLRGKTGVNRAIM
jgi:hypothetical protein